MAGSVAPQRTWDGFGRVLDWPILTAVLILCAKIALEGLTFMPAAGFVGHRRPLVDDERAALLIGAAALARWLLGGRALPTALSGGLAAVAAVCLVSLARTTDIYATRDEIFFLVAVVVLALAILICLTDRAKGRAFLAGLALIATAEAGIGLGQFASGEATPAYWLSRAFAAVIHTRIHGTLANPNVLAEFLLIGIGVSALLAMDLPGRARLLPGLTLVVAVAALPLTYSRGAYAGLVVFLLTAGCLLWPVRRRAWPVLVVIVAVVGLVTLRFPAVGLRAESVTLEPQDTATSRLFIWRTAVRVWEAHRIWGTGIGTFNSVYSRYRPPGVLTTYAALHVPGSAHNDYLELLAETGVVGLLILGGAALWGLGQTAWRFRRGDAATRTWLGVWTATAAAVGTTSVVDSTFFVISNSVMLIAFTAAVAAHESDHHPPLRFWQRSLALPLVIVLVGLPPLLPPIEQASRLHAEATAQVQAGRYAEAVRLFHAAMTADPLNGVVPAYCGDLLADLYLRRIDSGMGPWWTGRERAADLYERAGRLDPWAAYPRAALGRLRWAEGRYADAGAALRQAIVLDPYSPTYRMWLGETLVAGGDPSGAIAPLREAIRLYPLELRSIESHEGRDARYLGTQAEMAETGRLLQHLETRVP
ncbi:MAG TPA: O-antigen ligase family protein [bacterium]|nr:O-antigen ligase family protein [bacterium]